jgi:SulP family sulfate permease
VLAAFLFMRKMIQMSNVNSLTDQLDDKKNMADADAISNYTIPKEVKVFEITVHCFLGAAYKFKDAIKLVEEKATCIYHTYAEGAHY